jgi:hypothetical protein
MAKFLILSKQIFKSKKYVFFNYYEHIHAQRDKALLEYTELRAGGCAVA